MRRIGLVFGSRVYAPPLIVQAQGSGRVARLGLLGLFTPELGSRSVAAVREGLGVLGWQEGRNIRFEHRYASGRRDQLGALAAARFSERERIPRNPAWSAWRRYPA
jgi:hypothetical protein